MREMLRFATQNVPRRMGGEGLQRDGSRAVWIGEGLPRGRCEALPAMLGSFSDRPRRVSATSGVVLPI